MCRDGGGSDAPTDAGSGHGTERSADVGRAELSEASRDVERSSTSPGDTDAVGGYDAGRSDLSPPEASRHDSSLGNAVDGIVEELRAALDEVVVDDPAVADQVRNGLDTIVRSLSERSDPGVDILETPDGVIARTSFDGGIVELEISRLSIDQIAGSVRVAATDERAGLTSSLDLNVTSGVAHHAEAGEVLAPIGANATDAGSEPDIAPSGQVEPVEHGEPRTPDHTVPEPRADAATSSRPVGAEPRAGDQDGAVPSRGASPGTHEAGAPPSHDSSHAAGDAPPGPVPSELAQAVADRTQQGLEVILRGVVDQVSQPDVPIVETPHGWVARTGVDGTLVELELSSAGGVEQVTVRAYDAASEAVLVATTPLDVVNHAEVDAEAPLERSTMRVGDPVAGVGHSEAAVAFYGAVDWARDVGITDFAVGFGDSITAGLGRTFRERTNPDLARATVDTSSDAYVAGGWTGTAVQFAIGLGEVAVALRTMGLVRGAAAIAREEATEEMIGQGLGSIDPALQQAYEFHQNSGFGGLPSHGHDASPLSEGSALLPPAVGTTPVGEVPGPMPAPHSGTDSDTEVPPAGAENDVVGGDPPRPPHEVDHDLAWSQHSFLMESRTNDDDGVPGMDAPAERPTFATSDHPESRGTMHSGYGYSGRSTGAQDIARQDVAEDVDVGDSPAHAAFYVDRFVELSGGQHPTPHGQDGQVPGAYHASHAEFKELEMTLRHHEAPVDSIYIAVSREMCGSCRSFFQAAAQEQGMDIVIVDGMYLRHFDPGGNVYVYGEGASAPLYRATGNMAPTAGSRGYEGNPW